MQNQETFNERKYQAKSYSRTKKKKIKDFSAPLNKDFSSNEDLGLLSEPYRFNTTNQGR